MTSSVTAVKWACVFFSYDGSLSVVSRDDPKVTVVGEFAARAAVDMIWKRHGIETLYRGVIIKINGKNMRTKYAYTLVKCVEFMNTFAHVVVIIQRRGLFTTVL
jgi:hypothetical protein